MGKIKIKWIGQNGYILTDGKTEICIDPYLSDMVERIQGIKRMVKAPFEPEKLKSDVVICTHNHIDHIDTDAIALMKKEKILFLAPQNAEEILKKCGVINYETFDIGKTIKKDDFTFTAVYAKHSISAVGIIIRYQDITMYFSGDTLYSKELEKLKSFDIDVSFICINGKLGNMNVNEAVKLTKILEPRVAIPTHYGMFENNTENPERYISQLSNGFEMKHNIEYSINDLILKY